MQEEIANEESNVSIDPLDEAADIAAEALASSAQIIARPDAMNAMHYTLIVAQTIALVDIAKSLRELVNK